ncbi:MAG: enoyl-CoA hydratase [Janthinobacterium lividum]
MSDAPGSGLAGSGSSQAASDNAEALVQVERHAAGYASVTLNRPRALNALSRQLRNELTLALDALCADPNVRVLLLTGSGRAFCAGIDVKELATQGLAQAGEVRDPMAALLRFTGPVIGAINGVAVTGGFELALACDVLLASPAARFADTHARIGVTPGWGLSQRLSRAIGIHRAKELSLTGNYLSAEQAERWGLVNRVVPADELLPQARQLALDMLSVAPHMLSQYKKLIDDGFALPFAQAMALEAARSSSANREVGVDDLAQRQQALFARGRAESDAQGTPPAA